MANIRKIVILVFVLSVKVSLSVLESRVDPPLDDFTTCYVQEALRMGSSPLSTLKSKQVFL